MLAFYPLTDPADKSHVQATRLGIAERFQRQIQRMSNFGLAEFHALVVNRHGSRAALRAADAIPDGKSMVIETSETDQERAVMTLRTNADTGYSLLDATSFAIMERMKIAATCAYGRHFVQFGFEVLGLEE